MIRLISLLSLLMLMFLSQLLLADSKNNNSNNKFAQRIIALSPHSVEMLFAIGAGDRIVATLEYADYPEEALKILQIGNFAGIQIEKVVELQPDLIVAWKSGNQISELNKLESLGFNMLYSHPQNIEEVKLELLDLGNRTGLNKNAQKVVDEIEQKYQQIKQKYLNKSKIKVFYQLWHDPLLTIGPNNWIDSLIQDCHAENLFNDAETPFPAVSLESVLMKNPQVIIIPHHSGSVGAKQEIWKRWPQIDAIKNSHLFTINGDLLHRFTPRAIDGLAELCAAIDSAR